MKNMWMKILEPKGKQDRRLKHFKIQGTQILQQGVFSQRNHLKKYIPLQSQINTEKNCRSKI
jgi:hypothetical protein